MNARPILVSEPDLARLRAVLGAQRALSLRDHEHLDDLEAELERAAVLDESAVPADLVRLFSRVRLQDAAGGEVSEYTLVLPWEADLAAGRLSVLAPLGTALLGYREGDEIEWQMPGGIRKLRLIEVRRVGADEPFTQRAGEFSPRPQSSPPR